MTVDRWIPIGIASGDRQKTVARFSVDGRQMLLVRHGGGVVACERECPHEQADLADGHCRDRRLHCPRHQASFDLETGAVSAGWCVRPLRIFSVRTDARGYWIERPEYGQGRT